MVLTYQLWKRPEYRQQDGQTRRSATDRAEITIVPSSSAGLSTVNPAGIRDDKYNMFAMALIPHRKKRQAIIQNHQT